MTHEAHCIVASAQYPIDFLESWKQYENKIALWVEDAVKHDAQLLIFPEYASMELASLFSIVVRSSLERQIAAMQQYLPAYIQLFQRLSVQHGVYILSGTFPVDSGGVIYRNRALLFAPSGTYDFQEKLQLTRFENEQWNIQQGDEIRVFATSLGRIAINVCYDCEFPAIARQQIEAGAEILLVPSCTDTLAGYNRVRIGCQARALENQCYVVQSSTVGAASWSEAVDVNVGAAAVYSPVDREFPEHGILAIGELNASQWVYAELDCRKLHAVRNEGQVLNHRDWSGQFRPDLASARTIPL